MSTGLIPGSRGQDADQPDAGLTRRRVVGFLVAGPTLAVAVRFGIDSLSPAGAVVPTPDALADTYDLGDTQTAAAAPTSHLIRLEVRQDGTVHFALPRMEVGQGITTSTATIIADELDVAVSAVTVTLEKARTELGMNQLTGGSNTTMSTYYPIRTAAALARGALLDAASYALGGIPTGSLTTRNGTVIAPDGRTLTYGELAGAASVTRTQPAEATLKATADLAVVGKPHHRVDARDAVTGKKKFAMDLHVPGALPTMVCRPPTLNGTVRKILNRAEVRAMPGVTHVVTIATGVAVRARTFGQCIDAVRALHVDWTPGPAVGDDDRSVRAELKAAELPLAVPSVPALAQTVESAFTFWFASNSALETNCAIADVRADRAEIWGGFKSPNVAASEVANRVGLLPTQVTVHVVTGGGSFGRKLFPDAAVEAAEASKKMGVPVKLMWHRADDSRQGRVHPMSTSRVRATVLGDQVLSWEQRHTSGRTDFSHGYGDVITASLGTLPAADLSLSQWIYTLSQTTHYNFGATTNLLDELTDRRFNSGSMRNIYSPNAAVARELTVDQIARLMGRDPYHFRREFVRSDRSRAVLDKVAGAGSWGRAMGSYRAQGIGIHNEYHGYSACLVEIDCRPTTVSRKVREAVTGPRVTKVVFAVDVGLVVNPTGLRAQMMGGIMDGIALALSSSLHLRDGYFLEASWDNYAYTRQWNVPFDVEIHLMPSNGDDPGGAGEFGVAAAFAATAAAYSRATKTLPKAFPINHDKPLHFPVKPTVPPIPQSPTNGLSHY